MGNSSSSTSGSLKNHLETAEKTGALCFSDKKLDEFPPALVKVKATLRNLDLSKNKIPSLPSGIGSFKNLKTLRLNNNKLTSIPNEIGMLVKLECLFLQDNQLTFLPKSLSALKNLRELDVSRNQLSDFPDFLQSLRNLDFLNLSTNKITSIPDILSYLNASELNLNENQIAFIPEALASCPRLKTLRLEENCLSLEGIPTKILTDSKISNLVLGGNTFDEKKLAELDGYDKYLERYTAVRRKLD